MISTKFKKIVLFILCSCTLLHIVKQSSKTNIVCHFSISPACSPKKFKELVFSGGVIVQRKQYFVKNNIVDRKEEIKTNIINDDVIVNQANTGRDFNVLSTSNDVEKTLKSGLPSKKKAILLVTAGRSGSSFIGDVLKKHKQLLYHFEPLREINIRHADKNETLSKDEHTQEAVDYLNQAYSCKMSPKHVTIMSEEPRSKYSFARDRPELMVISPKTKNKKPSKRYNQACTDYASHILVKELFDRFPYTVDHLATRLENKQTKIIFLVRDPRATIYSFFKADMFISSEINTVNNKTEYSTEWNRIQVFCTQITDQYRALMKSNLDFLLLRYEDFCRSVGGKLGEILSFIDIPFDRNNIYNQFIMGPQDQNSKRKRVINKDTRFTTDKDTKTIFEKWRTDIPLSLSVGIENKCNDLMTLFGYKIVGNNTMVLRNKKYRLEE